MPVKPPATLKKFFPEKEKPSQIKWNHFFDSLYLVQLKAEEAYAVNGPIIWVADMAERLLIGPSVFVGRMVKQSDNGRTYVKQTPPGDNPANWEDIGDSAIVISDVQDLQTELDALIRKDISNSTSGILSAYSFSQSEPTTVIVPLDLGGSELVTIPFETVGPAAYAGITKDFTIDATNSLTGFPWEGMPVTLILRNDTVSAVQFNQPTDTVEKFWTLVNGSYPIVVPVGWHLTLAVHPIRVIPEDPAYTGLFQYRYFVTYGLQATEIAP